MRTTEQLLYQSIYARLYGFLIIGKRKYMANTNKKSSLNKFLVGPHDYTSTQILYL